ncbi:hypothetical protein [Streptomyces sp. Caat 7-52]|uniref:hypothetical protein n=1 Tax=Streptomyces sp. Caat 7-52 TaxID=2949637 RepID=UPI002035911E|nr:hypothetical protein [Streptomyces sp. Caat 7-52]
MSHAVRKRDVQDLPRPGMVAGPAAAGDEPVVPAGETEAAVPGGVLVTADQERGEHVERTLADEHSGALALRRRLTFAHL